MARGLSRREYLRVIGRLEGKIKKEYLDIIKRSVARIDLSVLEEAIESGDIRVIADMIFKGQLDMAHMGDTLRGGYFAGAESIMIQADTGFDMTSPQVDRWLKDSTKMLSERLSEDLSTSLVAALREGYLKGDNPRSTARVIAGKINKRTGRREGGIIGLTPNQSSWIIKMREELSELDPGYFTRKLRDKRFDATVRRYIESGKDIPSSVVDKIAGRYADRALLHRAESIARTESIRAIAAGRNEAIEQSIGQNGITKEDTYVVWSSTMDSRTRDAHASMNGQIRAVGEPFIDGDGNELMYPCDPDAPSYTSINCRCMQMMHIDFEKIHRRKYA